IRDRNVTEVQSYALPIFSTLIGMRLRRVATDRIVRPMIKATKAGLKLSINELEAHLLAGGNVNTVVDALIAAQRANIELPFEREIGRASSRERDKNQES